MYVLSVLYGRSEGELKTLFKQQVGNIPKWSKKNQEIADVHQMLQTQISTLRTTNKTVSQKEEEQLELVIDPIPSEVTIIQEQDYIAHNPISPDPVGSHNFYKNLVDALFVKHKTWVAREEHLKNRILELEDNLTELRNRLEESLSVPDDENMVDYN